MQIEIKKISFQEILPVWSEKLWPERKSIIETVSAIDQNGAIDMKILNLTAVFWGAFINQNLVGVISTHPTKADVYRLRGIFVEEKYRGQQVGKKLVETVISYAEAQNVQVLWTLGRKPNKDFYKRFGFAVTQEINTYEYGPHYLMEKLFAISWG